MTYSATTNAYMNLANNQASAAYRSSYLSSGGVYNPSSTSFTGGNESVFTANQVTSANDVDLTQNVSADGSCTDGADDGKISFGEKFENAVKGFFSPITSMFESPENFIKGGLMIAGGAILCAATGGAAAPLLVAAGVGMGSFQAVKGAVNAANAKTDAEAKEAWQSIGTGTSTIAMSVAGTKSALKASKTAASIADGMEAGKAAESAAAAVEGMGRVEATIECIKSVPNSASSSLKAFTSGAWKANLGLTKGGNSGGKNETPEPTKTETPKTPKTETHETSNASAKVNQQPVTAEGKIETTKQAIEEALNKGDNRTAKKIFRDATMRLNQEYYQNQIEIDNEALRLLIDFARNKEIIK